MMFKNIAAILAASLCVATASAQSISAPTPTAEKYGFGSTSGARVSLIKPIMDIKLESDFGNDREDLEDSIGFALGYAHLPAYNLGWTANFAYLTNEAGVNDFDFIRIDGNAAYSINSIINAKAGLNISHLVKGSGGWDDVVDKPGMGYQAGMGAQMLPNLGLDLNYFVMNQSGDVRGTDVDFEEKGVEFSLHGTF